MNCPNCQQSLSPPPAGRRQACSFCGWVEPPPADEPLARKAEEIARERQMDTEPVWRYLLIGLGVLTLLVLGFNTLVGAFQKNRPSRKAGQESPMPQFSPPAMVETQPTAPPVAASASSSIDPNATPAASIDPAAQASAQASGVAAAVNAAENGQPLPGSSAPAVGSSPLPTLAPGMSASPGASLIPAPTLSPGVSSGASPGASPLMNGQPGQLPPPQLPAGATAWPTPSPS